VASALRTGKTQLSEQRFRGLDADGEFARRSIGEIGGLGAYFGLLTGASPPAGTEPWLPGTSLLDGSPTLVARYRQVQAALAHVAGVSVEVPEFRVAASVGQLGLAARLFCPAFGAALLGYRLDLGDALYQPVVGGALPLFIPTTAVGPQQIDSPAPGPAAEHALDTSIATLVEHTAALSVSREVLWGNVASVIAGAVSTVATARPDRAGHAAALGTHLLSLPALAGTFTGRPGSDFRRRSCCLIYRITPGPHSPPANSYCGDCILR